MVEQLPPKAYYKFAYRFACTLQILIDTTDLKMSRRFRIMANRLQVMFRMTYRQRYLHLARERPKMEATAISSSLISP